MAPIEAHGMAAADATPSFKAFGFERRDCGPKDIVIDIMYCGICHSDIHYVTGDWGPVEYPQVPGHEIIGKIRSKGAEVSSSFNEGTMVGVGCFVDSCHECRNCQNHMEQYCEKGSTQTYSGTEKQTGKKTQGGYSSVIVVDESFVLKIPDGMDPASTAPLLCAGITTFSPLHHWQAGPGKKVGVVGLGGLGHMALKIASGMGCDEVVLFTRSMDKANDAKRLGATKVVISKDEEQMKEMKESLDLIIDTVSASHDLGALVQTLRVDGTLVLLGAAPTAHEGFATMPLISRRRTVAGSLVGGIKETQEMLDFCAKHKIASDIELIKADKAEIEKAYERMLKGDVKYRFVIDIASMPKE